jgi:hypothetical protein
MGRLPSVLIAVLLGGGAFVFRQLAIVPRATVGICAAANPPLFCAPRHAVLWMQFEGWWGWLALACGLAAFFSGKRPLGALAIGLGIAAVVNYNAGPGIVGAAIVLSAGIGRETGRYAPALQK